MRRLPDDEHGVAERPLVRFYNKRGTAEQWITEGKQATLPALTLENLLVVRL